MKNDLLSVCIFENALTTTANQLYLALATTVVTMYIKFN